MKKNYTSTVSFYQGMEGQLMPGEEIIWKGQPKKSAFVLNSTMNIAPFAIIWLMFDSVIIMTLIRVGSMLGETMGYLVPFFAVHLLPVWIWIYNLVTASGRWKNTEYGVTNKRIITKNGLVGYEFQSIYYTDITNAALHVGGIDRMLGVGDIIFSLNPMMFDGNDGKARILDVEKPEEVYALIQKTILDMQTDIHYPNALRPEENPGYHSQYRP